MVGAQSASRSRFAEMLKLIVISIVWIGLLIGVGANSSSSVNSPDLHSTPADLQSAELHTSLDHNGDLAGLRRLLSTRPDLRSVLEKSKLPDAVDINLEVVEENEPVPSEGDSNTIEDIFEALKTPTSSSASDQTGNLSTNLFFSPVFSQPSNPNISESRKLNKDNSSASDRIDDNIGKHDKPSQVEDDIEINESAISIQPKNDSFEIVDNRAQSFVKSTSKGIRDGNGITIHGNLPTAYSRGKATARDSVKRYPQGALDIRDINSTLKPKLNETVIHDERHKGHPSRYATEDLVVRNYVVNGIKRGVGPGQTKDDKTEHTHEFKDDALDNSNIEIPKNVLTTHNMSVEKVDSSPSDPNNSSLSKSEHRSHMKLMDDIVFIQPDFFGNGRPGALPVPHENPDTSALEPNSLVVEAPETDSVELISQRHEQTENISVPNVDRNQSSAPQAISDKQPEVEDTEDPEQSAKDFRDSSSSSTTSSLGELKLDINTNHGLELILDQVGNQELQLQDKLQDIPGVIFEQHEPASNGVSVIESNLNDLSSSDVSPKQIKEPKLPNTIESGSQDTLESGSEYLDSADEEAFPFVDILGRGGDLLKGVVVYTIDPFAARRRGGWRPVPLDPSPAVASARLTKGSVGADRKTKVTARSRDTLFSCHGREPGYYPVRQSGCQVYYHCTADGSKFQYRCGGGTAFNTQTKVCDHIYNVVCDKFGTAEAASSSPP